MPATPRIYHRNEWGALAPKRVDARALTDIRTVYVHYSDAHESIPSPSHFHDVLVVQAIQRYHMFTRGYNDIAYAALIGGDGDIYLGRDNRAVQAGVEGHSRDEWSVCLLSDGPYTLAQATSLRFLVYLAAISFPNVSRTPEPHSAGSSTFCPGDQIRALVAAMHA